jgi:hypothetical protein
MKKKSLCQMSWHMPIILATWEAETGGFEFEASLGFKTLSLK